MNYVIAETWNSEWMNKLASGIYYRCTGINLPKDVESVYNENKTKDPNRDVIILVTNY
jgi:hypothetical protein